MSNRVAGYTALRDPELRVGEDIVKLTADTARVPESSAGPAPPADTRHDANTAVGLGAYQAAINIYVNEANRLWSRFQAMLAVCTLLASASVGLLLQTESSDLTVHVLAISAPVLGVAVALLWLVLHDRGDAYMEYFTRSAREIEGLYLPDAVKTLQRGYDFSEGKEVSFQLPEPSNKHRVGWLGRRVSMKRVSTAVIVTFLVSFVALTSLALWRSLGQTSVVSPVQKSPAAPALSSPTEVPDE